MKATGRTTICTAMESIRGKMEENMKDNISKIESMDLESILGQTADNTKVYGRMDASMVKAYIGLMLLQNQGKVFGLKVKEKNGARKNSENTNPFYGH